MYGDKTYIDDIQSCILWNDRSEYRIKRGTYTNADVDSTILNGTYTNADVRVRVLWQFVWGLILNAGRRSIDINNLGNLAVQGEIFVFVDAPFE